MEGCRPQVDATMTEVGVLMPRAINSLPTAKGSRGGGVRASCWIALTSNSGQEQLLTLLLLIASNCRPTRGELALSLPVLPLSTLPLLTCLMTLLLALLTLLMLRKLLITASNCRPARVGIFPAALPLLPTKPATPAVASSLWLS